MRAEIVMPGRGSPEALSTMSMLRVKDLGMSKSLSLGGAGFLSWAWRVRVVSRRTVRARVRFMRCSAFKGSRNGNATADQNDNEKWDDLTVIQPGEAAVEQVPA